MDRSILQQVGRRIRSLAPVGAASALLLFVSPRGPSNFAGRVLSTPEEILAFVAQHPDEPTPIDWQILAGLDYKTGKLSEVLQKLNGKAVKVPGFMVPLEDFATNVTEFLLVPWFGACVHTPPPPPNQTVYVKMDGGKEVKVGWWDPVWIEGVLKIEKIESVYGVAGFQLVGMKITSYEM